MESADAAVLNPGPPARASGLGTQTAARGGGCWSHSARSPKPRGRRVGASVSRGLAYLRDAATRGDHRGRAVWSRFWGPAAGRGSRRAGEARQGAWQPRTARPAPLRSRAAGGRSRDTPRGGALLGAGPAPSGARGSWDGNHLRQIPHLTIERLGVGTLAPECYKSARGILSCGHSGSVFYKDRS